LFQCFHGVRSRPNLDNDIGAISAVIDHPRYGVELALGAIDPAFGIGVIRVMGFTYFDRF
jgi:hypothetical protein